MEGDLRREVQADIRRKVILAVSTDKSVKGRNPEHIAAFKELSDFLGAEVAVHRASPTDDLITHLAEAEIDGDRLSEREVVLTTATFVMAITRRAGPSHRIIASYQMPMLRTLKPLSVMSWRQCSG